MAWFFFVPQDPLSIALVVAILCGLLSSSTHSIGAYWPAHAAFALPCILPFAARCLMEPTPSLRILGLLSLLYLVFTASFARAIPRTLETQLRLQLHNERLVQQLTRTRDDAMASERDKSRFLAAASHDLRQPLHAMGLFVPALQAQLESGQPSVRVMRLIVGRMKAVLVGVGHLLDLLLDLSRLDAGTVETQRIAADPGGAAAQLAGPGRAHRHHHRRHLQRHHAAGGLARCAGVAQAGRARPAEGPAAPPQPASGMSTMGPSLRSPTCHLIR